MERANVEKILVMLKEDKISVDDALNLIEAVNEEAEEDTFEKRCERGFNSTKESVKKGFVKAGEVIGDIASKVNNVGSKCVESIREEFKKNNDEEIIIEEVKTEE